MSNFSHEGSGEMQETLASAHQSELGARWALAAAAGLNSLATSSRWPTQSIQLTYTVLLIPGETSGRSSMRSLRQSHVKAPVPQRPSETWLRLLLRSADVKSMSLV